MNTYAPSGCTFVYGREGELLARLGPEQRPRALLAGRPPARRDLTGEEVAWLGTWVPSGGVQHLDKSYGFRCGMELVEGIKLYDVGRTGMPQKVTGMEWEVWDGRKHSAARVVVECGTTDIVGKEEVEWLTEQLEKRENTPQYVREQQEVEVAGLRADTEQRAEGAWEELRERMGKSQECERRARGSLRACPAIDYIINPS